MSKVFQSNLEYFRTVHPRVLILENVEGITHREKGHSMSPLDYLSQRLAEMNYVVTHNTLDNADFIHCTRRRIAPLCGPMLEAFLER